MSDWKQQIRQIFTSWKDLAAFLELDEDSAIDPRFPLKVPRRLAEKMEKGNIKDPLLLQFLPLAEEEMVVPGFTVDPVGDVAAQKTPKLLHKYAGRVLLTCTSVCAMHCRYCFRQHFEYACQDKSFEEEVGYIAGDTSIHEVILSGGDPLSLSESILEPLLLKISKIPHVTKLRFHTRFPVGIPERVDDRFCTFLSQLPQQIWFVLHINHAREIDREVISAVRRLQKQRVIVLNQAVLLRGVNDTVDVQRELCESLINVGIIPYYIHQLDPVQGASHFEVPTHQGLEIVEQLTKILPGYAVPRYVQEIPGMASKTPV